MTYFKFWEKAFCISLQRAKKQFRIDTCVKPYFASEAVHSRVHKLLSMTSDAVTADCVKQQNSTDKKSILHSKETELSIGHSLQ